MCSFRIRKNASRPRKIRRFSARGQVHVCSTLANPIFRAERLLIFKLAILFGMTCRQPLFTRSQTCTHKTKRKRRGGRVENFRPSAPVSPNSLTKWFHEILKTPYEAVLCEGNLPDSVMYYLLIIFKIYHFLYDFN